MNEALETYFGVSIGELLEELDYLGGWESSIIEEDEEESQ